MHTQQTLDDCDYLSIVRQHPDSILLVDRDNKILFANPAGLRLLCRLPASYDYLPACLDLSYDSKQVISILDIAGHEITLDIHCQSVPWKGMWVRLIFLSDITEEARIRCSLEKQVYTDHLTGLYNRRGIEQLSENFIASARRHGQYVSLFYIDVNKLKQINDSLGHAAGDAAIIETANILRNAFRGGDVIARIGGDEFAVLVAEDESESTSTILRRLLQRIEETNVKPDRAYKLSLSIGTVQFEHSDTFNFNELLEKADHQMYMVKHAKQWNGIQRYAGVGAEIAESGLLPENKAVSNVANLY